MQQEHSQSSWRLSLLSFLAATLLAGLISGCPSAGVGTLAPDDEQIYAGDSAKAGITRAQDNETISCSNAVFDGYVCLKYEYLRELLSRRN